MKKILLMLLCLALALCGAGFAEEADGDGAITMQAICDANAYEVLTAKYALVGVNIINYAADGSQTDSQYFGYGQAGEILFENSDGYSEYYAGADRAYIFDPAVNQFYVRVFLDDAERTAYANSYRRTISANEKETLVVSNESEGVVNTQLPLDEASAANYEALLGVEGVSALAFEYLLDPETLEISQCSASVVAGDAEILISTVSFTYGEEALAAPEFVNSLANSSSTRTVTLVYNDVSTEYEIAQDALIRYVVPEGYEAYADADKTPLPDASETAGTDQTVYLLPIEKVAEPDAAAATETAQ